MHGKREVSDYEINGSVRRELTLRGIDLRECRYRTSGGAVELQGKLKFNEVKSPFQVIKELTLLEQSISSIRGVKRVHMEFEDWQRTAGKWERVFEEEKEERHEEAKETHN